MLFCMDVGNTNIVLGLTRGNEILNHWRIRTEKDVTADELGVLVANLFRNANLPLQTVSDVIVSCVVPSLLYTLQEFSGSTSASNPWWWAPASRPACPSSMTTRRKWGPTAS